MAAGSCPKLVIVALPPFEIAQPGRTILGPCRYNLCCLPRQAKLPLHGDWRSRRTREKGPEMSNQESVVAACNYAASLFSTEQSLFRSILDHGRW